MPRTRVAAAIRRLSDDGAVWSSLRDRMRLGVLVAGVGFELIFPSLGVEATRRAPIAQRGRAVANFIAFVDLGSGALLLAASG